MTIILSHVNRISNRKDKNDIKRFNKNVEDINLFYERIKQKDLKKIAKENVKKAKEIATKSSELTSKALEDTKQN